MKKFIFTLVTVCLLSFSLHGYASAEGQQLTPQKVNLSDTQKQELDKLHKQLFTTKKELINKYVEYGVFTQEQGDMMLKKMEERYQKLKENGYMMRWHHHQGKMPQPQKNN
ncbi:YckD family protein [Bacillus sp. Marseille-Q1617]|uniref:YckD family protein n=1 Tax=Bacillus sp. Marseille-Q1617 TaxID=2736887 RepID=UPI00158C71FE|nr:YckD family protein [Bacillus sp. Marseille-Q1617]